MLMRTEIGSRSLLYIAIKAYKNIPSKMLLANANL